MSFSDILRSLIEQKHITQKQMAQDLKIPASTLGGYVQGTSEPDFETLKLIAQYFGVSSDYFLDIHIDHTLSRTETDLLLIFRSLSPSE